MVRRTRWLAVMLTVAALGLTACDDDETAATSDVETISTTADEPQTGGSVAHAQAPIEIEITANGFNPPSAEVTVGQGINFNNNDSKPHTIRAPDGHEQVVKAAETFKYRVKGCCAARFTDEKTGAKFKITVNRAVGELD
jgi:plastocyanin